VIDLDNDEYNEDEILHRGKLAVTRAYWPKKLYWTLVLVPTPLIYAYLYLMWGFGRPWIVSVSLFVCGLMLLVIWPQKNFYSFENPYPSDPDEGKRARFEKPDVVFFMTLPFIPLLIGVVLLIKYEMVCQVNMEHLKPLGSDVALEELADDMEKMGGYKYEVALKRLKQENPEFKDVDLSKYKDIRILFSNRGELNDSFEKEIEREADLTVTLSRRETLANNIRVGRGAFLETSCRALGIRIGEKEFFFTPVGIVPEEPGSPRELNSIKRFNIYGVEDSCEVKIWDLG